MEAEAQVHPTDEADVAVEMAEHSVFTEAEAERWRPQELGINAECLLLIAQQLYEGLLADGCTPGDARKEAEEQLQSDTWRLDAAERIREQRELHDVLGELRKAEVVFESLCRESCGDDAGDKEAAAQVLTEVWAGREAELLGVCSRLSTEAGLSEEVLVPLAALVRLREERQRLQSALALFFADQDAATADAEAKKLAFAHPRPEGMRVDSSNGLEYAYSDFVTHYGSELGAQLWGESAVGRPDWQSLCDDMAIRYPKNARALRKLTAVVQGREDEASSVGEAAEQPRDPIPSPLEPDVQPPPAPVAEAKARRQQQPEERALSRERWLYENAAFARLYQGRPKCGCWRWLQEITLSPGFRLFFSLILYSTCALTLLWTWHTVIAVLIRLFLPTIDGLWPSLGAFSVLVMGAFFAGAWATQVSKCVYQWVLLTDDAYFGDHDFRHSDRVREKIRERADEIPSSPTRRMARLAASALPRAPVPDALRHLLPPPHGTWRNTFWGLPTGGCMRREVWLGVVASMTTVIPGLYAVARTASDGENAYMMIGHYVVWCLAVGPLMVLAVWLHAWYQAARLKYGAYARHQRDPSAGSWNLNIGLLSEWGLDQPSVARNLGVLAFSLLPLLITWWVVSTNELQLSVEWIVLGLVISLLMLGMREAVRASETSQYAPYVASGLMAVFVIFGTAATAQVSGMAVLIFLVAVFMTQGSFLRHGTWQKADVSPSPPNPLVPQSGDGGVADLRAAAAKHGYELVPRQGVAGKTWLPCSKLMAAIFKFPCRRTYSRSSQQRDGWEPPISEQHWRLDSARYNDPSWTASSLSSPLMLWMLLSSLLAAGFTLGIASSFKEPQWSAPGDTPAAVPGPSVSYPVCGMRWDGASRFSIVDFAFLADLSYVADGAAWTAGFEARFGGSGWELILPQGPGQRVSEAIPDDFGEDGGGPLVTWVHVYNHALRQHVVIPRSNLEGRHLMRDLTLWGPSAAAQVLAMIVPPLRYLTNELLAAVAGSLDFVGSALDDGKHVLDEVTAPLSDYVHRLGNCSGCATGFVRTTNTTDTTVLAGQVTLVGHGPGGALAGVVAARHAASAVTFGSPGTQWLRRVAGGGHLSPREVSVVSANDPVGNLDAQSGAVQRIECGGSMITCHRMRQMLCELRRACGDNTQRPLVC